MYKDLGFIKDSLFGMVEDKLDNMCDSEISEEVYDMAQDKIEELAQKAFEIMANNAIVNTKENLKAMNGYNYNLINDWSEYDEVVDLLYILDTYGINLFEDVIFVENVINRMEDKTRQEIAYDALYNYDALWMTAIQKLFGDKVTDTQQGYGMIEVVHKFNFNNRNNVLNLYPEDFVDSDTWKDVCDIVGVGYDSTEIKLFFDDEDVTAN